MPSSLPHAPIGRRSPIPDRENGEYGDFSPKEGEISQIQLPIIRRQDHRIRGNAALGRHQPDGRVELLAMGHDVNSDAF